MSKERLGILVLQIGVAFAFLYPPINALSNPDSWIGYFPAFMRGYVSDEVLLHGFGIIEVIIAFWILSGWRIFLPSLAATALLLGIVVFAYWNFEVVFRDLSIAAAALSLAIMSLPKRDSAQITHG